MATGTTRIASAPVFHGDDPEQTTEYSSLSVLAIISLIFGIAAPLAIAAPFLLAIPLFGIAVCLLALRRIAVSGGALAGRWAATVGLVLCVASAVFPISHDMIQRSIRTSEAQTFSGNWISLVTSGNLKQAFRMTVDSTRPIAAGEGGEPGAAVKPKVLPFDAFATNPLIKSLQAAGAKAGVSVRETLDYQATTPRNIAVRQLYRVTPEESSASAQPIDFVLSVQRAVVPHESMSRWLVTNFAVPTPEVASTSQH